MPLFFFLSANAVSRQDSFYSQVLKTEYVGVSVPTSHTSVHLTIVLDLLLIYAKSILICLQLVGEGLDDGLFPIKEPVELCDIKIRNLKPHHINKPSCSSPWPAPWLHSLGIWIGVNHHPSLPQSSFHPSTPGKRTGAGIWRAEERRFVVFCFVDVRVRLFQIGKLNEAALFNPHNVRSKLKMSQSVNLHSVNAKAGIMSDMIPSFRLLTPLIPPTSCCILGAGSHGMPTCAVVSCYAAAGVTGCM
ncbi:hypothetical protein F5Y11DRAFT_367165 [Daldinia sp. FL1419]|nr:hypothetical protein F5Y11DRAFT_367165 [Daldinia sp. FL1419]